MAGKFGYLAVVPALPQNLLLAIERGKPTPSQLAEARRRLNRIRRLVRIARQRFELATGRLIQVEPPTWPR